MKHEFYAMGEGESIVDYFSDDFQDATLCYTGLGSFKDKCEE